VENKIPELIKKLSSKNSIDRIRARYELVKIGKPAIEYLIGLQYLNNDHVRWEAIKTLSQIAHPDAIPILINALENDRFDVRWLAAEGLIDIGKKSVKPLLKALELQQDSKFLREGVHHVLRALKSKNLFKDEFKIIKMLEDPNAESLLAFTANKILSKDKLAATEI
jgi:HEAT repeat protein